MYKFVQIPVVIAIGSLLMGGSAHAQSANSQTPGQYLFDHGIVLSANYTGEAASNPSGGIRQGTRYAGQVGWGADIDFEKMMDLTGTSLHFAMVQRHGRNLADEVIGNSTSVQEIYGTQDIHLANLTLEQKLFDGRLDITAGRTVANIAFLSSPIYCNFQSNSACGNPTFIFKDSNFTYWPASSWGGDVKGFVTDKVYIHAGVYEVNPHNNLTDESHGFNLRTNNATGVVVPYEVGYATSFANDTHPRHYQVGGWYDESDYSDPLVDANGDPAITSGLSPVTRHGGRSGLFARFDQVIWRPDPGSQRNLTLFGVAMAKTSGRVNESHFFELGLLQTGTFPGRDEDTLGFVINDQEFTGLALDRIRAARIAAGGNGDIPEREIMMELAYGAQLTSAIRISPNLQYIINPDQINNPSRTEDIPNAFVVGLKFTVDLSNLAGFSPPAK